MMMMMMMIIIIKSIFLDRLSMGNVLNCAEQVQTQKCKPPYENIVYKNIL